MDIFVARQPIFDANLHVVAYELLYRSGDVNRAFSDGDSATSSVIVNSLLLLGLEKITDGKRAFINFTRNLLVGDSATMLMPEMVVVEVLETVQPDSELLESLDRLKREGYRIALDDYVIDYPYPEITQRADIIKVDFLLSSPEEIQKIAERFRNRPVKLLAEKVETYDQFRDALKLGYHYFQGYFFSKPNIVSGKDMKSFKVSQLQLLKELNVEEPDIKKLTDAIEQDLALSYKLLRLVNSAAYYSKTKVQSIQQALVRVGFKEIRKWITLIMLRDAGKDKPEELVRGSLVRARALELLGERTGLRAQKSELFLVGLFSRIDVILGEPMEQVLQSLPLEESIRDALGGKDNLLKQLLDIFVAYETGDWLALEDLVKLGIAPRTVADAYYGALTWTREVFGDEKA